KPRPRAKRSPASMMINSRNRLKWIGQSWHHNYTNSTRNDEEAVDCMPPTIVRTMGAHTKLSMM
ncbi:MAG: hypothetical protein AB1814_00450, partial [Thermodesulfobacteriota bacterium]